MTTATPDAMRRFRPDWTSALIPQRDDDAVIKLNVSQINQGGPARSMTCCTSPEALACSINSTTRPAQELRETPHVLQAGASESEPAVWRIMVCADVTLRKASSEDARAIAVIQVQASRAAYEAVAPPGYFYGFTAPRRVAAWRTIIARRRDTEQIIVAEESGQIRGYAHFGPSRDPSAPPSTAELYSLYVAPSHWRRGFGRRLLAESLRELARMTFDDVTLWVLATNRPARAFYERFGWTADGSEKAGHPAMTEVRYRTASGQWADADIDAQADRLIR